MNTDGTQKYCIEDQALIWKWNFGKHTLKYIASSNSYLHNMTELYHDDCMETALAYWYWVLSF